MCSELPAFARVSNVRGVLPACAGGDTVRGFPIAYAEGGTACGVPPACVGGDSACDGGEVNKYDRVQLLGEPTALPLAKITVGTGPTAPLPKKLLGCASGEGPTAPPSTADPMAPKLTASHSKNKFETAEPTALPLAKISVDTGPTVPPPKKLLGCTSGEGPTAPPSTADPMAPNLTSQKGPTAPFSKVEPTSGFTRQHRGLAGNETLGSMRQPTSPACAEGGTVRYVPPACARGDTVCGELPAFARVSTLRGFPTAYAEGGTACGVPPACAGGDSACDGGEVNKNDRV